MNTASMLPEQLPNRFACRRIQIETNTEISYRQINKA